MKKKPWYFKRLDVEITTFPACCGISVVTDLFINVANYSEFDSSTGVYTHYEDYKISQIAVSSEIKRVTSDLRRGVYKRPYDTGYLNVSSYVLTITDRDKKTFKFYDKALKNAGWKEIHKCKTAHKGDNYNIHMYGINFKKKRKEQ